ncbi:hypothetical protein AB0N65_11590 [Paenarthrobacter sp. NPDC089322]|uniref:YxiG-like protein n=1 Tax=Paenarthrobacter sp. NPDC089322 TaxID=3155065 RepID=UPI003428BBEE
MNGHELLTAFEEASEHRIVFHSFAEHLRDYDVFIYMSADPRSGIKLKYLPYRFTHCVRTTVKTAISPKTLASSLDERLLDYDAAIESGVDGHVWGVNFHELVFSDLVVTEAGEGFAPFVIPLENGRGIATPS